METDGCIVSSPRKRSAMFMRGGGGCRMDDDGDIQSDGGVFTSCHDGGVPTSCHTDASTMGLATTVNAKVKEVERFTTFSEFATKWEPSNAVFDKMEELKKVLTAKQDRVPRFEQYNEMQSAMESAISTLYATSASLTRHRQDQWKQLENLNEYLVRPEMWLFAVGEKYYLETPYQLLEIEIDGVQFEEEQPLKRSEFCEWVKFETNLSYVSRNEHLARARVGTVMGLSSTKALEIQEKKKRRPKVVDGKMWFMFNGSNNGLVLQKVPETFNSIETCDKVSDEWVRSKSSEVLEHACIDSSLTLSRSAALALVHRMSPSRAKEIAKDEKQLQELGMKFEKAYSVDNDDEVSWMERRLGITIRVFKHTGDFEYKGDVSACRGPYKPPIQLVRSPNGRYYTLICDGPPSFASEMALLHVQPPVITLL
jgi:hypothetical protein